MISYDYLGLSCKFTKFYDKFYNISLCTDMPGLICPLCPYERTSQLNLNLTNYLKHIKLFHSHQPSFSITCGLDGCLRIFHNFRTFQVHVSAFHSGDPSQATPTYDVTVDDRDDIYTHHSDGDGDISEGNDSDQQGDSGDISLEYLKECAALFLMGLKEKHKLTQVVLQGIIDGVTNLIQGHLSALHTQVCKQLSQSGVSHSVIADLDSLFSDDGPFLALKPSTCN